jgi:hypothetical protein
MRTVLRTDQNSATDRGRKKITTEFLGKAPKPKVRNWGTYTFVLRRCAQDANAALPKPDLKTISLIDQIRELHRNLLFIQSIILTKARRSYFLMCARVRLLQWRASSKVRVYQLHQSLRGRIPNTWGIFALRPFNRENCNYWLTMTVNANKIALTRGRIKVGVSCFYFAIYGVVFATGRSQTWQSFIGPRLSGHCSVRAI